MSRREKLVEKMSRSPGSIRFSEVAALLRHEGFVLFKSRGSHRTFRRADGRILIVVAPHGGHETCHPEDIRKLLGALGR